MLEHAAQILRAVPPPALGRSAVLDLGMPAMAVRDYVAYARPILTEWKLCATGWFLVDRSQLERKIAFLREGGVTVIAGGTAGEIAAELGTWTQYVSLCRAIGIDRVEIGEGFLGGSASPKKLIEDARAAELEVQYEVGRKDLAEDQEISLGERITTALSWVEAGASYLVLEAREVGSGYAVFRDGRINLELIEALLEHFGLDQLVFETPTRKEYCAVLRELGPGACLGNIYPHELFRVEMMRRGIHADTFDCRGRWFEVLSNDGSAARVH